MEKIEDQSLPLLKIVEETNDKPDEKVQVENTNEALDSVQNKNEFYQSVDEYFANIDLNIPSLFPFLALGGVGFLFGSSTLQKSSFAYYLAKCIAINEYGDWDGHQVPNGKVLIVQLEEARKVTYKRFNDVLDNPEFKKNVKFMSKDINWNVKDIDKLKNVIEDLKPSLVIIDSLSKANRNGKKPIDADYGDFIFDIQDVSQKNECTVLFIHHTLKDKNTFAGTQKIFDNGDFVFRWTKGNKRERILTVEKNRFIDDSLDKSYGFELNFETNKWIYIGEITQKETDTDPSSSLSREARTLLYIIQKLTSDRKIENTKQIKSYLIQKCNEEHEVIIKPNNFKNYIDKLIEMKLVEKCGDNKATYYIATDTNSGLNDDQEMYECSDLEMAEIDF